MRRLKKIAGTFGNELISPTGGGSTLHNIKGFLGVQFLAVWK